MTKTAGPSGPLDPIELGKHIVDKGILDRNNLRCGKVDDLVLQFADDSSAAGPELVALITGPKAFAATIGHGAGFLARLVYRMLGIADAQPVEVRWNHVRQIDAVIRLDIDAGQYGINALSDAVAARLFSHLPGASDKGQSSCA
jgi:hypothetical protein